MFFRDMAHLSLVCSVRIPWTTNLCSKYSNNGVGLIKVYEEHSFVAIKVCSYVCKSAIIQPRSNHSLSYTEK